MSSHSAVSPELGAEDGQPRADAGRPEEDLTEVPAWDWIPVRAWNALGGADETAETILDDLEDLERVIRLMSGGGSGAPYLVALEFLRRAQRSRRDQLAELILREHGMIPREPGTAP